MSHRRTFRHERYFSSTLRKTQKFAEPITKKLDTVAEEIGASKEVKVILKRIAGVRIKGDAAIKAREKVAERQGRVSLRISTWKDDANHARRSVESALETFASEQRLPRTYSDEFFPLRRSTKKDAEAAPSDAPPPT